jgi:NADH-quinone oxidoreductase subunit L
MVTAGVYLIARTHVIFQLAPVIMTTVAIVGALTLLIAGFAALTQSDIKRALAYSTISQIGYMFLALGVGAWSAGVFHFVTHAFFKALLFMGAGAIIVYLHHQQDMFQMGGLRKQLPVTFWTFLIGSASLAALPLVTSGFYSKDLIIWLSYSSDSGSVWLWTVGLFGAFITAIYTFRMVFLTFYGEAKSQVTGQPGFKMKLPLIVLAGLSIVGGFVELPETMGHFTLFSDFLHQSLPAVSAAHAGIGTELLFQVIAAVAALGGIYLAYLFFLRKPKLAERMAQPGIGAALHRFWFSGWGFDWLYDHLFVKPYTWLANINRQDIFDLIYTGIAGISRAFHRLFSRTQTGRLRWYAMGIVLGAIITIYVVVL